MNWPPPPVSALWVPVAILIAGAVGCDSMKPGYESVVNSRESVNGSAGAQAPPAAAKSATAARRSFTGRLPSAVRAGKLEFRVGEGEEVFSFKPNEQESCKFSNAAGEELCKLSYQPDGRLKAKSPSDSPLFELKPKDEKVMLKDASGENELLKFKLKGDTIDVYLPNDQRIYRLKRQEYGWRLEDNADQTLFRAKSQEGGRQVLRDLSDQTVLYSNDLPAPLGLLFFKIPNLTPEQQAACCLFFMEF